MMNTPFDDVLAKIEDELDEYEKQDAEPVRIGNCQSTMGTVSEQDRLAS